MAIISFPPVEQADEHGLLALGGDLEIPSLLLAYSQGIFPWPISKEYPLAWFSPDPRGIITCHQVHIPRSLKKKIRKENWQIKFNTNFEQVINLCAQASRKDQDGTWITTDIIESFIKMFQQGYAYSTEVYENNKLVGGLYGVHLKGFYSGESMFFLKSDASKLALVATIKALEMINRPFLDTQMVTPVVKSLGAIEISRNAYINKLKSLLLEDHRPKEIEMISSQEIIRSIVS